jgi:uncharacterized repeat protein (TIGR03806 family)
MALGCGPRPVGVGPAPVASPPEKLSTYGLFRGDGSTQEPADGVLPYDVNSALFSDYAAKYRFVRLPPGASATYHDTDVFDFPVGTVLVKTFAFPFHLADPSRGRRLVETRLLVRNPDGWAGLPYVWNEEQTEATLQIAGGTRDVAWVHADGSERVNNYIIPNVNQCRGCHEHQKAISPIGPAARHLNRDYAYAGGKENQLAHWSRAGHLRGAPPPDQAPKLAAWDDPASGTLGQRARAWLEVNCAHCHNPHGPANNAGLDLRAAQAEPYRWGLWKSPVAAGRGSGGRSFDVVPGRPDESILLYRIQSTDPGVMMPELARRLVDEEGVALIREWIAGMPPDAK